MERLKWSEMSNSEIEVKLKELESEYNKIRIDIGNLYTKLQCLNNEFIKGSNLINKRINAIKK